MRNSKQRQVVYDAVLNSCDHPTAETILTKCKSVLPSVNLATVYRNLNTLVLENKIKRISQVGGDRFDKTLCNHAHFRCNCCNEVFDVLDIDVDGAVNGAIKSLGEVDVIEVSLSGTCANCLSQIKN